MKKKKLRWGLLSTARINRKLIPPLKASPRNELSAIASRDLKRAQQYAQEWGIPTAYGRYEDLLNDPSIDVIYNSLPNSLHAEWTIKALQAGKHVLCEKPLALTLTEVDAITLASEKAGRVVAEAFMYRHHAQTLKVKELVESGVIGQLRLVRGSFSFYLDNPSDVRMSPALGGGCLWDIGCYPVSYARYIIGAEPAEVFGWQIVSPSGVDIHFTGQLRFPGQIYAQFDSSFCTIFRTSLEIVGSAGSITIPRPFAPGKREEIFLNIQGQQRSIPIRAKELYLGEVEDMADAVLDGKPPRISLKDSRANTAALLALYQSAKLNTPVPVYS